MKYESLWSALKSCRGDPFTLLLETFAVAVGVVGGSAPGNNVSLDREREDGQCGISGKMVVLFNSNYMF